MPSTNPLSKAKTKKKPRRAAPKLSRQNKPANMSLEEWQKQLRREFGREQKFSLKNVGDRPAFSDFLVANPQSRNVYRVTVRGTAPGDNHCTCPDFATNSLGTCKHIEFTLARLQKNREAAQELKAGYHPAFAEVVLRYGDRREIWFIPPADASPALIDLAARFFEAEGRIRTDALPRFDDFVAAASALDADIRVADEVFAFLAELRDADERRRKVAEAFPRGVRSAAFKDLLKISLYDYQREGVLFAARAGRCLLGDEMGLGKTAQALAVAEVMARLFGVERVLVVCPTSLKHQWKNEIARFTDRSVRVIEGGVMKRKDAFADPAPFFKVMNYDTVYADVEPIATWSPDLVILDEAQRIKNWSTRAARSVKKIRSPYAVVLTGTPLENRLEELISIVQFVDPHRLGPTYRLLHDHQLRDDGGRVIGYQHLDRIGETLAPVLLRRQKEQVLTQLPERVESTVFVPLTPTQRDIHTENKEVVARIVAKWRRYRFLSEADKLRLMSALQNMRMACDSSYLVDPKTDHGLKVGEVMTVLGEALERPGVKAVVFSQWLRMHELLVIAAKDRGWGHVLFSGGVAGRERGKLVDRFRDDPDCRLFFSTDAGGVGLNLQFASVVVNVDLPWNPAVLEQRIGRVHRLGQEAVTRVVNVVGKDSIEHAMLSVLAFKKSLFAGVLDGGPADVKLGGNRLTKFMETVEATTSAIPAPTSDEGEEAAEAGREFEVKQSPEPTEPEPREPEPASSPDPWSALIEAGSALLRDLATPSPSTPSAVAASFLRRDETTGETYLRLPAPAPELVNEAVALLAKFAAGLRR